MRVLVAEDDKDIAELLVTYLEREGYQVFCVEDGRAALECFSKQDLQMAILDISLPFLDGFGVCREIRKRSQMPILFLSARDDTMDKILGLELGADDYLVKPFYPQELILRLQALQRRSQVEVAQEKLTHRQLELEPQSRRVHLRGEPLKLTRTEFDLLQLFVRNLGRVLTREQIIAQLWRDPSTPDSARLVDAHLRNLRSKLRAVDPQADWIRAVRGIGYRLD